MAKNYKKFNIKNHTGFYTDRSTGEEKKELRTVGELVVFSDQLLPDDISILIKMYDKCVSGVNSLSAWQDQPRNQQSGQNNNQGVRFN